MILTALVTFCIGLLVGSFLNVAIYRLPRGLSLWAPRSHCPSCRRTLGPGELVPLLSFLRQRGRCRGCEAPISWRYPLVELTTGLLLAGLGLVEPRLPSFLFYGLFGCVLITAAAIDLEHRIIPNRLLLYGLMAGLPLVAWLPGPGAVQAVMGLTLAGGAMLAVAVVSRGGMGMGDVKLAGVMGFFLGPPSAFAALLLAVLAGGFWGAILLLFGRKGRKDFIPFGPFLAMGGLLAIFAGPALVTWYLAGWRL